MNRQLLDNKAARWLQAQYKIIIEFLLCIAVPGRRAMPGWPKNRIYRKDTRTGRQLNTLWIAGLLLLPCFIVVYLLMSFVVEKHGFHKRSFHTYKGAYLIQISFFLFSPETRRNCFYHFVPFWAFFRFLCLSPADSHYLRFRDNINFRGLPREILFPNALVCIGISDKRPFNFSLAFSLAFSKIWSTSVNSLSCFHENL